MSSPEETNNTEYYQQSVNYWRLDGTTVSGPEYDSKTREQQLLDDYYAQRFIPTKPQPLKYKYVNPLDPIDETPEFDPDFVPSKPSPKQIVRRRVIAITILCLYIALAVGFIFVPIDAVQWIGGIMICSFPLWFTMICCYFFGALRKWLVC